MSGGILAIAFGENGKLYDAWNGRSLKPLLRDGKLMVSLTLGPRDVGCVVAINH